MSEWILSILSALFVGLTLLPFSKSEVWWVRAADFPRVQFSVLGIGLVCATLVCLEPDAWLTWVLAGLNLAAIGCQAWWVWPYTRAHGVEVKQATGAQGSDRIKIMSANVLMTNDRAADVLRIVRAERPDVVVLLETNLRWENAMRPLEAEYPHRPACPLENLYGMHLYSRLPFEDPKLQFLVEPEIPSMHTLLVLPSGRRVCLHCLHPAPPSPTENETSRERDAELVMVGRSVRRAQYPVIVSGDLNDVAWSATTRLFRKVSGLLDPRVGRGMFNTFHAGHWWFCCPVDHFFHSRDFTVVRIARLPFCGSDHFPVLIELEYAEQEAAGQEGLAPEADDNAEAEQKLAQEGVAGTEVHRPGEDRAAESGK